MIFSAGLTDSEYTGWEDYISQWRGEPWAVRMYPFGDGYFDQSTRNGNGQDAGIHFTLPYYGRVYSSAFISIQGHIELSNTNPATNTPKAPDTSWPNENYPQTGDVPFISPYYAQFEMTDLPVDNGILFWRKVDPSRETDPAKVDIAKNMLKLLSEEVRKYVVGSEEFLADYALIVTWSGATFYGCLSDPCPVNTVQVAVITDERSTYVVYNYYELNWIGGLKQGYDSETGLICQRDCVPAQVGFNAGRAEAFYGLPLSRTDEVIRLAEISGTGVAGRFIYKVDSFNIVRGGCSNISDIDPVDWPLELNPDHGTLLGGQAVYLSGPCFLPQHTVHCMFDDVVVEGWRLESDYTRAVCVTPFIRHTGRTIVRLSTDNQNTWPYTGWFTFDLPDEASAMVILDFPNLWYNKTAHALSFHWEPSALDDIYEKTLNITSHFNVDIWLCVYSETLLPNGTAGTIKEFHVLEENIPNSGAYTFNVDEHHCLDKLECNWEMPLPLGLIEIRRKETSARPRSIWSQPFPLGWYGNNAWYSWHGDSWPEQFCSWWFDLESGNMTWLADLEPCPVTSRQAKADPGRFVWNPCNSTSPTVCSPGQLMSCYEQITPNANEWPSVSYCCYNDDSGQLVYAADNSDGMGSFSARASYRGHRKATHGNVPLLSHYTWDSVLRVLCCNWTADPKYCQDMYARIRPSQDASGYTTPTSTTAFGDPHFRTFDGVEYTFNGRGEYWLLRVFDMAVDLDNIVIQVRLEKPSPSTWGDVKAAMITSVVMQEGYADDMTVPTIEVQMAEPEASVNQTLLVNGESRDLRAEQNRRLEIVYRENSRVIIITNNERTPYTQNKQNNISVIFQSGVMVQVAFVEGALHVFSSLPSKYMGKTAGLFGLWNGNKDDDLTTPGGEPIDFTKGNEFIHYNFGEKWVLSDSESRFTYRGSLTSSDYHHPDFVPFFTEPVIPPNSTLTENDVDEACGTDFVCRFDYKTTLSRSLAITSSEIEAWTSSVVDMSQPVPVCSYLDVPYSRREVSGYTSGGTVNFTGCSDGYTLLGQTEYTCTLQEGTASWQPTPDVWCKANSVIMAEKQKRAIMIATPICCLLVAAGLAVGGYFLYKHQTSDKGGESAPKSDQFSYRSGSGINPLAQTTVYDQNVDRNLAIQWTRQCSSLAGSADLGLRHTYPGLSGNGDVISGHEAMLSPNGLNVGDAESCGNAVYAEIRRNPRELHNSGSQSAGQSFWSSLNSLADDQDREEHPSRAGSIARSTSQMNILDTSGVGRGADEPTDQPVVPLGSHQNEATGRSEPHLIQFSGGSTTDMIREQLAARPRPSTPSSSLYDLERPSRVQDRPEAFQPNQGYTNLAASMGSMTRASSTPSVNRLAPASRFTSQTSPRYAGAGCDNVAMATEDDDMLKAARSRSAAYATISGADTEV